MGGFGLPEEHIDGLERHLDKWLDKAPGTSDESVVFEIALKLWTVDAGYRDDRSKRVWCKPKLKQIQGQSVPATHYDLDFKKIPYRKNAEKIIELDRRLHEMDMPEELKEMGPLIDLLQTHMEEACRGLHRDISNALWRVVIKRIERMWNPTYEIKDFIYRLANKECPEAGQR